MRKSEARRHAEWWYAIGRCEAEHHNDVPIRQPCADCLRWAADTMPSRYSRKTGYAR
jgi:hypothetical protein